MYLLLLLLWGAPFLRNSNLLLYWFYYSLLVICIPENYFLQWHHWNNSMFKSSLYISALIALQMWQRGYQKESPRVVAVHNNGFKGELVYPQTRPSICTSCVKFNSDNHRLFLGHYSARRRIYYNCEPIRAPRERWSLRDLFYRTRNSNLESFRVISPM